MKINHVMAGTNWNMLAEQKLALSRVIRTQDERGNFATAEYLTGLLHWIDAIQDAAALDGFAVTWPEEK
jgi:hypothetical protein